MILKHLITLDCDRNCSYCVTNHMLKNAESLGGFKSLREAYLELKKDFDAIAITGGEPTLDLNLIPVLKTAKQHFNQVSLWTNNWATLRLQSGVHGIVDDIMLGIHENVESTENMYVVEGYMKVYASVLTQYFHWQLPGILHQLGFSGMTIREQYPDNGALKCLVNSYVNFPVRYRKKEECYGGFALLPDLTYVRC